MKIDKMYIHRTKKVYDYLYKTSNHYVPMHSDLLDKPLNSKLIRDY